MKTADIIKRIEELEKQVRELQSRPVYVPVPQFVPVPQVIPQPWYSPPQWQLPQIWCDTTAQ